MLIMRSVVNKTISQPPTHDSQWYVLMWYRKEPFIVKGKVWTPRSFFYINDFNQFNLRCALGITSVADIQPPTTLDNILTIYQKICWDIKYAVWVDQAVQYLIHTKHDSNLYNIFEEKFRGRPGF